MTIVENLVKSFGWSLQRNMYVNNVDSCVILIKSFHSVYTECYYLNNLEVQIRSTACHCKSIFSLVGSFNTNIQSLELNLRR
jgi:hypothetical protein